MLGSKIFLFILLTFNPLEVEQCCLQNLSVWHNPINSSAWGLKSFNSTLDPQSFGPFDIGEIHILCDQYHILSYFGKGLIKNLVNLTKLSVSGCSFETIAPGAFVNLVQVTDLVITYTELNEVVAGAFDGLPKLKNLNLDNNKLVRIEQQAFNSLDKLSFVNLNQNMLDRMRREWFGSSMSSITTFFIQKNLLKEIPQGMFLGWSNLKSVNLDYNQISVIHSRAFEDIAPTIENLGLHHNHLKNLSLNSFSSNARIDVLRISANLFNYVPESFLMGATIKYLYVHGNPLRCSCLDKINMLATNKGGMMVDYPSDPYILRQCKSDYVPVCVVPKRFDESCFEEVDEEVTKYFFSYLRKIGWDRNPREKCAMFDVL
ncbi:chondroadherin-like [Euwallacea fornicatus]|uniref:chondroadherin-like n=1 Tax=Euwallacea fornicatus TaxID=995702 RepID=UPI00338D3D53